MQIKTYTGRNATVVLAKVKAELGPDAVILSSRQCREGERCWHEMTVGVEHAAAPSASAGRMGPMASAGDAPAGAPPGWGEWHREWTMMKEHLYALMKPALRMEELTPRQRVALEYLGREGVDDAVIMSLHRRLAPEPGASVLEALADMVPVRPWSLAAWPQKLHAFAGPFGAGKTTAMLRMALALRRERPDLKVVLVNADCGRGHGRLLLKHYAELSDLVYREASNATELAAVLRECADAHRVLVDLPGVSRDGSLAAQLGTLGIASGARAVHLVLPPHHGPAQMAALLARYAFEGPGSLVWTKLDEACTFGALVNVAAACGLPASALSYGPGLRNSLVPAGETTLWRMLFKRQLPDEASAAAAPGPKQATEQVPQRVTEQAAQAARNAARQAAEPQDARQERAEHRTGAPAGARPGQRPDERAAFGARP